MYKDLDQHKNNCAKTNRRCPCLGCHTHLPLWDSNAIAIAQNAERHFQLVHNAIDLPECRWYSATMDDLGLVGEHVLRAQREDLMARYVSNYTDVDFSILNRPDCDESYERWFIARNRNHTDMIAARLFFANGFVYLDAFRLHTYADGDGDPIVCVKYYHHSDTGSYELVVRYFVALPSTSRRSLVELTGIDYRHFRERICWINFFVRPFVEPNGLRLLSDPP